MNYVQTVGFSYFAFHQDPLYRVVTKPQELEEMMNALRVAKCVAYDYETNGLAWWRGKRPCGVAFTTQAPSDPHPLNYYVPFRHITGQDQLSPEVVIGAQKEILENAEIEKLAHNAKFELHMSRGDGLEVKGPLVDTMIEARLWDEDLPAGLKERLITDLGDSDGKLHEDMLATDILRLAKRRGLGVTAYKDLVGYSELEIFLCGAYAAHDTYGTWNLHQFYEQQGVRSYYSKSPRSVPGVRGIYDIEMRLVRTLAKMEQVGQPLDTEYLTKLHTYLLEEKQKAESAFFTYFGCEYFNLGSDDQLRYFLQHLLKCQWNEDQYTEKGQPAVDSDVIAGFAKQYTQLEYVLRYKEVDKKLSTYTLGLIEQADELGILHCNYQQVGTVTGRLSCRQPNLQNISSDDSGRAKENKGLDPESIKRAFVIQRRPEDPLMRDWVGRYGSDVKCFRQFFDYSQIELRVLADYTKDEGLVKAYREDKDIHDEVEKAVFGTCITYDANGKKIDGPNRRKAKVINFGLSYCMSPVGFARQIKEVTPDEAQGYFDEYNRKFPGVGAFRELFWRYIRMNKCQFDNKFGRTRHVPAIVANDNAVRRRSERMSIATLIQGTASELTKQSLVLIDEYIEEHGLASRISQTIHDEIQIDGPVQEFAEIARMVKTTMEAYPDFCVPIKVDGTYSISHWSAKIGIPGLK